MAIGVALKQRIRVAFVTELIKLLADSQISQKYLQQYSQSWTKDLNKLNLEKWKKKRRS